MNNKQNDLAIAIKYFDLYYFLAAQDLKSRFRRSYLGISWIAIHQLVFSLFAGFIWAKIFGLEPSAFIPFLTIGSVIWSFISAALLEGCATFIIARGYLKQLPLPQSIFVFRTLLASSFYLAVGLFTAVIVLATFDKLNILGLLYMLPGALLLLGYFYGVSGTMAYLGLRYRDLQHALTAILSLLFIVTPVMYPPEVLIQKGIGLVIYMNPFASLIEIIRYPLLKSGFAPIEHYCIALAFVCCTLLIKSVLKMKWGRLVPFWV